MNKLKFSAAVAVSVAFGFPLAAQNFTTAAEVRPILGATQAHWIAVRPYEGRDLLYFSNLLAWRCGLEKIEYTVNDIVTLPLLMEPCHSDEPAPNALKVVDILPYVEFPLNSVETVSVTITYDDGEMLSVDYERASIQIQ